MIINELERYNVVVTALQETKWFGSEVYQINGSIVLTSGRDLPLEGENSQRGEGVAIVLTGPALSAWNFFKMSHWEVYHQSER